MPKRYSLPLVRRARPGEAQAKKKQYTNARTGQLRDPKTGVFLAKCKPATAGEIGAVPSSDVGWLEILARGVNLEKLAKKIRSMANRGDAGAISQVLAAIQATRSQQAGDSLKLDYAALTERESWVLAAILRKASHAPPMSGDAAILESLIAPAPVTDDPSEDEEETDAVFRA